MPAFPIVPGQIPVVPAAAQAQSKKKEKPLVKVPIPGTDWLRVKTTEGNTFYSHKIEKRSVWTVPDEIKEAVVELERQEAEEKEARQKEEEEVKRKAKEEKVERVKAEVKAGKRKAEVVPVEEVVISKKAKVEEEEAEAEDGDDDDEEDEDEDESDMEDWQREAAEQLAKEAVEEQKKLEETKKREEEERERLKVEAEAQKNKPLNMPDKVDLSIDEAKALFKVRKFALYEELYERILC